MKKWSIRTKITLLFTVALTLMATLSCLIVFSVSHQVFFDWDQETLTALSEAERDQLFALLTKVSRKGRTSPCTKPSSAL